MAPSGPMCYGPNESVCHLGPLGAINIGGVRARKPLNESKEHLKNEVLVNSDRIKYADQFLLTKLDEIVTGL